MNNDVVILVVDNERNHADGIAEALEKHCANAIPVYSGRDALQIIQNKKIDIVITDLKLNDDIDGLDLLRQARKKTGTEVVLITAYASIETCKEAIRHGAYDYLVKPIDIDELRTIVDCIRRKVLSSRRNESIEDSFVFKGVMGENKKMERIFDVLRRVAPANISVLIEGQSGTGKELLAKAIHDNSARRNKPFRPVNCAGLSETLLESELFGHVKGAFTGASCDRKGLFEIADRGTLFLDEIGDMPLNMQAKLLRVLEDGIVVPVGAAKSIVVDVRVVSATNHDLTKLIEEKKFRQDLYFRIKGVSILLPSLRDRIDDLPVLLEYFLKEAVAETGSKITGITSSAKSVLMAYDWPGNIRQLKNCIRMMVVMCDREKIDVQDLPSEIVYKKQLTSSASPSVLGSLSLNEIERQAIIDTLAETDNNREKAAKILGIGERTLYRKIKEYNL